jgi:hypothetical protein
MKRDVTAVKFYNMWLEKAELLKDRIEENWGKRTEVTDLVLRDENCLLGCVAAGLGLNSYSRSDYYSIDAVLYKDEDKVPDLPDNNYWLRAIRVAFEHENNFRNGLFQEVAHLLITNCEIRVLTTYPTGYEPADKAELDKMHKLISGVPDAPTISEEESFLFILGKRDGYSWEGYVYKSEGWKRI